MSERIYIVTYIAADGQKKTDGVVGRNHLAVERVIEKRGGTVIHLDRDEVTSPKSRTFRHTAWSVALFVIAAMAVVAYFWYRMR